MCQECSPGSYSSLAPASITCSSNGDNASCLCANASGLSSGAFSARPGYAGAQCEWLIAADAEIKLQFPFFDFGASPGISFDSVTINACSSADCTTKTEIATLGATVWGVSYKGYFYRSLTGVSPTADFNPVSGYYYCDDSYAQLPAGFEVAPNTADSRAVSWKSPGRWGTSCMVLSDGTSWATEDAYYSYPSDCGSYQLVSNTGAGSFEFGGSGSGSGSGSGPMSYRVSSCDRLILIRRAATCPTGIECKDVGSSDGMYSPAYCSTYAPGGANEGRCQQDGMCGPCSCSCRAECPDPMLVVKEADCLGIASTYTSSTGFLQVILSVSPYASGGMNYYHLPGFQAQWSLMGAAACTPCPAGTSSPSTGASYCSPCAAGTFAPTTGSVACGPRCGVGYYSTTRGESTFFSSTCYPCPRDFDSPTGSSSAANCTCAAGFFGPHGGPCEPCPAGTYKKDVGVAAECRPCPVPGQWSPPRSVDEDYCVLIPQQHDCCNDGRGDWEEKRLSKLNASWGGRMYRHCALDFTLKELRQRRKDMLPPRFKTGGLGKLMQPDVFEVWACVKCIVCPLLRILVCND